MLFSQEWKPGDPVTDVRDGQAYKTVVIGKQCWTAENMNIGSIIQSTGPGSLMKDNSIIEKYCWDGDNANCNGTEGNMKRGGFYEWQEAMQFWGGQPTLPVQGICPKNWHIPSNAEWNELLNYLGGAEAYKKMVKDGGSGFDALMTGYRCTVSGAYRISAFSADTRTYFWSAEQTDAANAPFIELGTNSLTAISYAKSVGLCVRCLWDNIPDVKGPNLNLNIQDIDFGEVNIGDIKNETFEIENTGTDDLDITKIEITSNSKGAFTLTNLSYPLKIKILEKRMIVVSFSPKDESMYLMSKVNITSNAANGNLHSISLRGKGVKVNPIIECQASKLSFGKVNSKTTSEITIQNTGKANLNITNIEIQNDTYNVFSIINIPHSFPVIVNPSGTFKTEVSFEPKDNISYTGALNFTSNASNAPDFKIDLEGTGEGITDVPENIGNGNLTLKANPNPFSKSTIITYNLNGNEPALIEINIIGISGNIISKLLNEAKSPGEYRIEFKNEKIPSGKYFVIAKAGHSTVQIPIILEK